MADLVVGHWHTGLNTAISRETSKAFGVRIRAFLRHEATTAAAAKKMSREFYDAKFAVTDDVGKTNEYLLRRF